MLVSLLDSIIIKYNSKILFALYTDNSIHIGLKAMTVVSSLTNIYYYWLYDTGKLLTWCNVISIRTLFFKNNGSIASEQHIAIWIREGSFTNCLVWILENILIQYNSRMIFELSTDYSNYIPIISTTEVSVMNHIMLYG